MSAGARATPLLAVGGGLLWIVSWSGNGFTDEGSRQFLGLGEGGWRELLNPALVALGIAVWGLRRTYGRRWDRLGTLGFWLTAAGGALVLVGNLLEWGLNGELLLAYGWGVMIVGHLLAWPGLVLTGIALLRTEPRARVLLAAATVAFAIPIFPITVGLGWILWGAALLTNARSAPPTSPVGAGGGP